MKHLHAFIFLFSIIVFSLTSCKKDTSGDVNNNIIGFSLTKDGNINNIVNDNLSEAVNLDLLDQGDEKELDFREGEVNFTTVSKGSISQAAISEFETVKRFKWDITHESEGNIVTGPAARLAIESKDMYSLDVDMKNTCAEVSFSNESKAMNIFEITNVRSFSGPREIRNILKNNPFVFVWTKDGTVDRFSTFNVVDRAFMFELVDAVGGGTEENFKDLCLYFEFGLLSKNAVFGRDNHRTLDEVPADDWLQVRLKR